MQNIKSFKAIIFSNCFKFDLYYDIITLEVVVMKKSHIIIYLLSGLAMLASYLYYLFGYITAPATLYMHSYHLAGFAYLLVPVLFEIIFRKELKIEVLIGYILFIFASQVLGSTYDFYSKWPLLDSIVHGFSCLIVALFISSISKNMLNRCNLLEKLVYIVGFSMIVGVVWEIVEFCADSWFGMNNQIYRYGKIPYIGQEALKDTMIDFICDLIGAIIGAAVVIITNCYKTKGINKQKVNYEENI